MDFDRIAAWELEMTSAAWAWGLLAACVIHCTAANAQSLPPTSRTVYKCTDGTKVTYSDAPCLGATKLEVEPTRGLNQASGKERVGPEVRRELQHEQFVNAVKPVTGLNVTQFDAFGRRTKLGTEAQRECNNLDKSINAAEAEETSAGKNASPALEQRLFQLRTNYRNLRC